jgi:hypothetical protein|tara:strand:+ start:637 stop:810 length:174 start_codon:yes stop_codon:yes gene_type:complete
MEYKVWLEIEAIDEEADSYKNLGEYTQTIATFDCLADANQFVIQMAEIHKLLKESKR